jgi:hypothetical protein
MTSRELWQRRSQTSQRTSEQDITRRSSEAEQATKTISKTVRHLQGNKVLEGSNVLFMH